MKSDTELMFININIYWETLMDNVTELKMSPINFYFWYGIHEK
jgi:hypothetical protein